jgi:hypothetical protein
MRFRLADAIPILLAILIAVGAFYLSLWGMPPEQQVAIRAENRDYLYPLNQDKELEFEGPLGTSYIEIKDGRVRVKADPTPRQIAVNQGWISKTNETLISLPNAVFIRIIGPLDEDSLDAVVF